jgi:hypothetical protein
VDQISPPFRIALVAMVAVCALWFTVLKPKDPAGADAPPPTAPGATGLANGVNAAKGASAASDAASAKVQAATGGSAATSTRANTPATAAAGTNGAAAVPATDPSAPLLRALERKHAVVLLFWNRRGSDDRAVRRAVGAINRHHGRVVVRAVPVSRVGRYEAIVRGAQVVQAPTTLVIAPDRSARSIAGFTTTAELDQAAADALAAK